MASGSRYILWHVDPLLGNHREIRKYATAVTKQRLLYIYLSRDLGVVAGLYATISRNSRTSRMMFYSVKSHLDISISNIYVFLVEFELL